MTAPTAETTGSRTQDVIRVLNFAGMLGMLGVALGAYWYQFSKQELPCTLCLLQRVAMIGVAFGAAMNVKLGPRPVSARDHVGSPHTGSELKAARLQNICAPAQVGPLFL